MSRAARHLAADTDDADRARATRRVAWIALIGGIAIMGLKLIVFAVTNSAAALGDALESIVNIAAAAMAVFSTWYASRPADREHPYGHGRVEFVAVGVEGTMVFIAGVLLVIEAARRLAVGADFGNLGIGALLLAGITILVALLGFYIARSGARLNSPTLRADGRHLLTDALTTAGVVAGLALVQATGLGWIDPVLALGVAAMIFYTGSHLIGESWRGLMDHADPQADNAIRAILDSAVNQGTILSYHKVRHRAHGNMRWIDLHIQVPGDMTVRDAHAVASRIEHALEQSFSRANATAHIEPPEGFRGGDPAPAARR